MNSAQRKSDNKNPTKRVHTSIFMQISKPTFSFIILRVSSGRADKTVFELFFGNLAYLRSLKRSELAWNVYFPHFYLTAVKTINLFFRAQNAFWLGYQLKNNNSI